MKRHRTHVETNTDYKYHVKHGIVSTKLRIFLGLPLLGAGGERMSIKRKIVTSLSRDRNRV
jgi:hypothetical protein